MGITFGAADPIDTHTKDIKAEFIEYTDGLEKTFRCLKVSRVDTKRSQYGKTMSIGASSSGLRNSLALILDSADYTESEEVKAKEVTALTSLPANPGTTDVCLKTQVLAFMGYTQTLTVSGMYDNTVLDVPSSSEFSKDDVGKIIATDITIKPEFDASGDNIAILLSSNNLKIESFNHEASNDNFTKFTLTVSAYVGNPATHSPSDDALFSDIDTENNLLTPLLFDGTEMDAISYIRSISKSIRLKVNEMAEIEETITYYDDDGTLRDNN